MDDMILTPNSPLNRSSDWPTNSPGSSSAPGAKSPASLPSIGRPMKPMLVPNGGSITHLGATVTEVGVNFAVYSESATNIWVSVFDETDQETDRFELDVRQDNIFAGLIAGLTAGTRYG